MLAISGTLDLNSTTTPLTRTITVDDCNAPIDLLFSGAITASGAKTGINKTGL